MNDSLINYDGIDNLTHKDYTWIFIESIEGNISLDESIHDLLSFSVAKSNNGYKCIKCFNDSNVDGDCIYGNLFTIKNTFELNIECSYKKTPNKISFNTITFHDARYVSLNNYNEGSLKIKLLIDDLFCSLTDENNIFYCIKFLICIDEIY